MIEPNQNLTGSESEDRGIGPLVFGIETQPRSAAFANPRRFEPRRAVKPRLRAARISVFGAALVLLSGGAAAQQITAFSGDGTLSWTNGLIGGVYEVQWSPSLSPGSVWTNDWSGLVGIQGTQSVFSVSVPMFYRVKGAAYPEVTDISECYLRYSNALLDAAVALPEEVYTRLRPVGRPPRLEQTGGPSRIGWMAAPANGCAWRR